ncbi:MAG: acetoin utilization protein AcuC [Streptosporangiaceae bacterium]
MTCTLHVAWDERLSDYHFGPGHPMAPVRIELTMRLAHEFGLWRQPGVTLAVPEPATSTDLQLVHDAQYVTTVQTVSRWAQPHPFTGDVLDDRQFRLARMFGLGTEDNPVFPGMHEASALVAGATLAAARAVWSGSAQHGASIAGGMHHAMAAHASGFGIYNDPAIAIAWLLSHGAERVAYVDIDAHHGDGVQAAFYSDPRVLTISLHQHPATLFPFTGLPAETGGPGAEGSAVNVALPPGARDAAWLRAFHAIVPPLLRQFRPQILVSQHGCDSHRLDPLANLELSIDAQRAAHAAIHALAHDFAGGRWLLTGGGGYELVRVVPLTWTHLMAEAAGQPIDPGTPTPQAWRDYVARRTGLSAPGEMTDQAPAQFVPFESGCNPADPMDQAIMATRNAVFPLHGLMPL